LQPVPVEAAGILRVDVTLISDGTVKGVISMNDIVLASEQGVGPDAKEIVSTLAAICVYRTLTPGTPGTPAVV
jgi:hypothetical protein